MKRTSTILAALAGVSMLALATGIARAERALVRIAIMPDGAEVTGLSTNVLGDLFLNAQHPGGHDDLREGDQPATLGYIYGFDSTNMQSVGLSPVPENPAVAVNGGEYVVFGKAGEQLGSGEQLGGVYGPDGGLLYVSNAPDFNGFIPTGANTAWLYTAWEGAGREGMGSMSKLSLSRVGGKWQADLSKSRMVDLRPVDGGHVLCSGTVTPWGTPLFAEEYFFYNTATWNHPDNHDEDERASFQKGNDINYIKPKNVTRYLGRMGNPYRYGYMIEINHPAAADGEMPVKHYATGRLSHEVAAIMPDMRTVYMTDDDSAAYADKRYNSASGGVLFKFVADRKGDLSAGTLFAAKLAQDAEADPSKAGFDVEWLELGHGDDAEIAGWIAEYDGIEVADYVDGQTNYISDDDIRAYVAGSAKDARAAFLESRRTAAAMGATNEWDKLEGVTHHGSKVYVAASALAFTMDKSWGHVDWSSGVKDEAEPGAIALNAEGCGATYVAETGDDYNITRLDPFVVGRTQSDGSCDVALPANPDNILALDDGTLLIGEDAGKKKHPHDMLWMVK
ncbi:MAG: DUF839 domain-containing protein [Nitratireductor sp.]|nr:DUF839 domain-containing protein [Nitratireductor sp.]